MGRMSGAAIGSILGGAAILATTLALPGSSRARTVEPSACAEEYVERLVKRGVPPGGTAELLAESMRVVPASFPGVDLLPVRVFEAQSTGEPRPVVVRFVLGGTGTCGFIGGDLDRLVDLPPDRESRMAWGLGQYNGSLDSDKFAPAREGTDRSDYLLAVLSAVSGPQDVALVAPSCGGAIEVVGTGELLKGLPKNAVDQVRAPVVRQGNRITSVLLFTLEGSSGAIVRNEAYVRANGQVDLLRETIATRTDWAQISADSR